MYRIGGSETSREGRCARRLEPKLVIASILRIFARSISELREAIFIVSWDSYRLIESRGKGYYSKSNGYNVPRFNTIAINVVYPLIFLYFEI